MPSVSDSFSAPYVVAIVLSSSPIRLFLFVLRFLWFLDLVIFVHVDIVTIKGGGFRGGGGGKG